MKVRMDVHGIYRIYYLSFQASQDAAFFAFGTIFNLSKNYIRMSVLYCYTYNQFHISLNVSHLPCKFRICQLSISDIIQTINMEIPECPVVRPTLKEFQNFSDFIEKLDQTYKQDYGIVKVIPPPEWKARNTDYSSSLSSLHIDGPIEQNLYGKGGIYQCLHIAKKSMSFDQYRAKSEQLNSLTQGKSIHQIEQSFWKNVAYSPPLYGADLLNSLMEPCSGGWDLKNLKSVLTHSINHQIKGVNTPYCYVGQWKALFCWHKEDLDLSAINYIHKGKSKIWYGIRSDMGHILERQASRLFPEHFSRCNQLLRHKTILINPYLLKRKVPQLVIHKVEQKENEFMIAFGGAYHCGFNTGFNFAEAVNYASLDWLVQLTRLKQCNCLKSSVKASPIEIYNNLLKSPVAKTKQFQIFQQYIFKKIEQEVEDESEDEQTKKAIKQEFKKVKNSEKLNGKTKKIEKVKKITYKGQDYQIDNWIECEVCKTWRIVNSKYPQKKFMCQKIGKKCLSKEKTPKNFFVVNFQSTK